jgi:hypothetical protein
MSRARSEGTSRRRRRSAVGTAGAAVALALLAAGCGTPQQVRWFTYGPRLQQGIDGASASGGCALLQQLMQHAKSTNAAHQKASGISNDALIRYIDQASARAGC